MAGMSMVRKERHLVPTHYALTTDQFMSQQERHGTLRTASLTDNASKHSGVVDGVNCF